MDFCLLLKIWSKAYDHAKQLKYNFNLYHADTIKTFSKRVNEKTAEATGDLISNKIVNRITIVSKDSQENISEAVTNNHDKEIPKEKYAPPEERQEIINELRLK